MPHEATRAHPTRATLKKMMAPYQGARITSSIYQLLNTFPPFVLVCTLMYASLSWSYWLTLALSIIAAGLTVRIFIIQHDCGHGSFLPSPLANAVIGYLCSIVTFTPYASWRRQHAGHHAHWNNLDRRETGVDIYSTCVTVTEYRNANRLQRLKYRIVRHPLISLVVLPPLIFLLLYRVPFDMPAEWRRERRGIYLVNLALFSVFGVLGWSLGFINVLMVHLPIMIFAALFGVWLFSVQHRFERTFWASKENWSATAASLRGSSYLKLPKILQWFSGNIGFHHIHHLNPMIPNYRLQECHDANSVLQTAPVLTLPDALKAWRFALWDQDAERMVGFGEAAGGASASATIGESHG
ncbi:fatty acid desaturase family protein [Dongia soli]|uniref:Fatty acid desaturase n=1 Tax=Dongia soli TaxID=600628 RepID=A0ABU5EFZ7_9PROT|nr:fatty acid desaturase [Dongia soli]MDY0885286.1 fatty acid desaturase [Dongia soli]